VDILIVDDVETDRKLAGKVVTDAGHRALYANDGEEALTKAKQLRPGLILLDVVMPKLNGFNTCRKLKSDPETKTIPVVLVTNKTTESDKFWGIKQGADAHVGKPYTPDQILAVIQKHGR